MHYLEQILICCSASAILSISLGGIAGAAEPMGPLRVSQINPRYFTDDRGQAIYASFKNSAVIYLMETNNEN